MSDSKTIKFDVPRAVYDEWCELRDRYGGRHRDLAAAVVVDPPAESAQIAAQGADDLATFVEAGSPADAAAADVEATPDAAAEPGPDADLDPAGAAATVTGRASGQPGGQPGGQQAGTNGERQDSRLESSGRGDEAATEETPEAEQVDDEQAGEAGGQDDGPGNGLSHQQRATVKRLHEVLLDHDGPMAETLLERHIPIELPDINEITPRVREALLEKPGVLSEHRDDPGRVWQARDPEE